MTNTNMQKITADAPEVQSADLVASNIAQLKALFPELLTEGSGGATVNLDVLKELVGDAVVADADEKYGLNWHGKRRARQLALSPSSATLLPLRDKSVNWNCSENLLIEGENLEVLKLLQKSYSKRVKMIYIDPPYNTGKDFIYADDFSEGIRSYLEKTGQSEDGVGLTTNPETGGRMHTNWLNMMYPRLRLARSLLRLDGLIFISIDDREMATLRCVLDELFGQENYCATFVWNTEGNTDNQYQVKVNHEYVVCYYRDASFADKAVGRVIDPNTREDSNLWKGVADNNINKNNPENPPAIVELPIGFPCAEEQLFYPRKNVDDEFFKQTALDKFISDAVCERYGIEKKSGLPVKLDDMVVRDYKLAQRCRIYVGMANRKKLVEFIANDCKPILDDGSPLGFYLNSNAAVRYTRQNERPRNILSVLRGVGTTEKTRTYLKGMGIYYDYPKPLPLIEYLIKIGCEDPKGIVVDFFAGSGTTGHAVMNLNRAEGSERRFICVQIPEITDESGDARVRGFSNLSAICRKRLELASSAQESEDGGVFGDLKKNGGFRFYRLADSNFKAWAPNPENLQESLVDHAEHLTIGRTEEDIIVELLCRFGIDLCVPVSEKIISGKVVRAIGAGVLMTCLSEQIDAKEVEGIAQGIVAWHQELAPSGEVVCVFRDSAFADDVAKTNMAAILQQHGIQNVRSL